MRVTDYKKCYKVQGTWTKQAIEWWLEYFQILNKRT